MKTDLLEPVTRYEVYQELLELWRDGIVAIETIKPQYRSKVHEIMLRNLGGALSLLDEHLNKCADFDMEKFKFMRTINAIPQSADIPDTEREAAARHERENKKAPVLDGNQASEDTGRDSFS